MSFSPTSGLEVHRKQLTRIVCCFLGMLALATACEGQPFSQQEREVLAIALSPDGRYLAIATDIRLQLYEVPSLSRLWSRRTGKHPMVRLTFSPDAETLATISTERVTLWNAATGQKRRQVSWKAQPVDVRFSPDGSMVAVADGEWTLTIWDSDMRAVLRTPAEGILEGFKTGPVQFWAVTWCPDGATVALMEIFPQSSMHSWHADTGERLAGDEGRGYSFAHHLACSSDGQLLVFDDLRNRAWGIWDVVANRQTATIPPLKGSNASSVAWLANGERLALGALDGTIVVWDVGENVTAYELTGHTVWPVDMVAPVGTTTLISVSKSELIVWDLDTREQMHFVNIPDLQ